jgi:hypothetical protein
MAHVRASVVPLTFSRRSTTDGSGPTRPWLKGTTLPGARVLLRRADDESALLAETVADGRGRFAFQRRVGAQGKLLLMATLPGHALRWAFVKG